MPSFGKAALDPRRGDQTGTGRNNVCTVCRWHENPIFYINLATRGDRREFMERQFQKLAIVATRIEAVTPDTTPVADSERYCDPSRIYWLTPGELACNLSHVNAMLALLRTEAPFGVVFEDDVVLSSALPEFLGALERDGMPAGLIKIETFDEPLRLEPGPAGRVGRFALQRPWSWSAGAAGYVVSRRAAEIASRSLEMRYKQVDRVLFNPYEPLARHLAMRHAEPALCIQQQRTTSKRLSSGLDDSRNLRREIESAQGLRRLPLNAVEWIDRELRIGVQKLWHQYVGKAKKRHIPFAG